MKPIVPLGGILTLGSFFQLAYLVILAFCQSLTLSINHSQPKKTKFPHGIIECEASAL